MPGKLRNWGRQGLVARKLSLEGARIINNALGGSPAFGCVLSWRGQLTHVTNCPKLEGHVLIVHPGMIPLPEGRADDTPGLYPQFSNPPLPT